MGARAAQHEISGRVGCFGLSRCRLGGEAQWQAIEAASSAMKKKTTASDLAATLKKAILSVIEDERSKPADKNKAIELGVKLVMVEAKIEARGDGGQDDNFFSR